MPAKPLHCTSQSIGQCPLCIQAPALPPTKPFVLMGVFGFFGGLLALAVYLQVSDFWLGVGLFIGFTVFTVLGVFHQNASTYR